MLDELEPVTDMSCVGLMWCDSRLIEYTHPYESKRRPRNIPTFSNGTDHAITRFQCTQFIIELRHANVHVLKKSSFWCVISGLGYRNTADAQSLEKSSQNMEIGAVTREARKVVEIYGRNLVLMRLNVLHHLSKLGAVDGFCALTTINKNTFRKYGFSRRSC
ncbi:MAG: hypothetical protein AAB473_01060 [Patescibacteria group bacterium]